MSAARVIVAAGHVPGAGARGNGMEEGRAAVRFVDALAHALTRRGCPVSVVPHKLDLKDTIAWVNARQKPGDRPLEVHFNAASNTAARGCMIAVTTRSRAWGGKLLDGLIRGGVPRWGSIGVYDEVEVARWRGWSHLGFPHQTGGALIELGFVTNADDARLFTNDLSHRRIVEAVADALAGPVPAPKPKLLKYTILAPATTIEAVKRFLRERKAKAGM